MYSMSDVAENQALTSQDQLTRNCVSAHGVMPGGGTEHRLLISCTVGMHVTGIHTANVLTMDDVPVVQKLWAEGGVTRFFKGWTPCLLRAFPANGIMLLTVDKVSYMLA